MRKMRSGFSLVMAIIFMVLVATIATFALSISATTAKHTTDIFLREQAELLAQSATEIAVQNLLGMTFSAATCPDTDGRRQVVNRNFPNNAAAIFTVTVDVVEMFGNINGCGTAITATPAGVISPSAGTVILDVTVTSNPDINIPIRFHRRTIQKL